MSSPLADFVWESRYRLKTLHTEERTIEDTWERVARAVAAAEQDSPQWRQAFRKLLQDYRFLPGGRILAGAGTGRAVTLCNCFVMGPLEDSIPGIFEALKEGALTMQQGGGVGYDFSPLRPRGCHTRGSGTVASGPVSFMHIWDTMCATMTCTGARRGAMMATLRCDHPDIEAFIDAKRAPGALSHFNLSVLITHAFMQAVRADEDWPLVFPERGLEQVPEASAESAPRRLARDWSGSPEPVACRVLRTVRARALWRKLCDSACASAEPGILFIDRINSQNNLGYRETISATNPCGEVPLPPYGACTLGSLNLAAFVQRPFSADATVDGAAIRAAAGLAVRFLDNVIDISQFPLARQREEAQATRRIGLGLTGLADALAMLGLSYDSRAARQTAADLLRMIRNAAYAASIELARVKGAFPAFEHECFLERPFIRALPRGLRANIARHGIRNGHLIAIAPAGSISLLAGNVSSGIEPIIRLEAQRRVRLADGSERSFDAVDYALAAWRAADRNTPLPEYFMEARNVAPADHLLMQAALQPLVDASISKTVALQADARTQEVARLYTSAYALGLKGCTVFRQAARAAVIDQHDERELEASTASCCAINRSAAIAPRSASPRCAPRRKAVAG